MCSSLFASRNAIKSNISLSKGLKLSNLEIYHLLLKNISTILNKWTIFGSEKSHRSTPSKISYFPPLVHDSIILVSSCEETRVDSCVTSPAFFLGESDGFSRRSVWIWFFPSHRRFRSKDFAERHRSRARPMINDVGLIYHHHFSRIDGTRWYPP